MITAAVSHDEIRGGLERALDQDAESCEFVRNKYCPLAHNHIEVANQSIRTLLTSVRPSVNQQFDLIYSAGLYDYLLDRPAMALTSRLCSMLRPGGRLVIANFVPESGSRGYAEAFMDWRLIYRTPAALAALFGEHAPSVETQMDPHGNVVYASLQQCADDFA